MARLAQLELIGRFVRLEPLGRRHVDDLVEAAGGDRTTFAFTRVPDGRDDTLRYVDALVAARDAGEAVPFAQCRPDGTAVGCTRFMTLRRWRGRDEPDEVEVGGTWLAPSAQRSPINTETKYLLLRHAFETWGVWRVDFAADARNERSRAAVQRTGATFEGILRNHRPAADSPPDHPRPRARALYSITDRDWPVVADRLRARLDDTD
ncbi:MAG: GNAT family protein [Ilumatobacteraceae bacterium]